MFIQLITFLCALQILTEKCKCLSFIDLPSDSDDPDYKSHTELPEKLVAPMEPTTKLDPVNLPAIKGDRRGIPNYKNSTELAEELEAPAGPMVQVESLNSATDKSQRRFVPDTHTKKFPGLFPKREVDVHDGDKFLKQKISALIEQTVHDTTRRVNSVQKIKESARELGPYKAGFILSMVRKSRLMLNDLFNLAVKHRDNWKALQQLKVFEYIVHTNVDTTNLVRQLVEIHINHLNATTVSEKRRVVLL